MYERYSEIAENANTTLGGFPLSLPCMKPSHYSFCLGLILLLGIHSGCGPDRPEGILSPEEMQEVLTELHLAEGVVEQIRGTLHWRNAHRSELYDNVLQKFGLDRPRFYESYDYYLQRPKELDSIYHYLIEDMTRRMQIEQLRMDGKTEEEIQQIIKEEAP